MTLQQSEQKKGENINLSGIFGGCTAIAGLEQVDKLIEEKIQCDSKRIHEIASYLLKIGGKRFRPALTLLSAKLFTREDPSQELIDVSAGIELIHMATLLHDDIIDRSAIRRHKPSPLIQFGEAHTLLVGDFLLTRAFSLCAKLDQIIINATEDACVNLTEGEITETPLSEFTCTLFQSLEIARKKTASLFKLACLSGAHLSGAGEHATKEMKIFGENLGIAFQIIDDVLDVISSEEVLGKQIGADIREKKPSIVNVLWLESGDPLAETILKGEGIPTEDQVARALVLIKNSSAINKAKETAINFTNAAKQSLDRACLAGPRVCTETKEALYGLINFAIERVK